MGGKAGSGGLLPVNTNFAERTFARFRVRSKKKSFHRFMPLASTHTTKKTMCKKALKRLGSHRSNPEVHPTLGSASVASLVGSVDRSGLARIHSTRTVFFLVQIIHGGANL
jgi:hypothetical protein